jgi:hypothetical protein
MDCAWSGFNNLTKVITFALVKVGGLTREKLLKKLLCFGANGALGWEKKVTKQIKET